MSRARLPHLHLLPASLCLGLAAANLLRLPSVRVGTAALSLVLLAAFLPEAARPYLLLAGLGLGGLWWASVCLDAIDRSPLTAQVGRGGRSLVVVTGPARRGRYELRVPATVRWFEDVRAREPVLLELPLGRAPPQRAVLEVLGVVSLPRGPEHGFDERTWLRRRGVHVVLRGDRFRVVGRRGGLGGLADRLHAWLGRSLGRNLKGEHRAVLEGVVLGEDEALSDGLRRDFRASGLYHLLVWYNSSPMRLVGYIRVSRVGDRSGSSFISPDLQEEQIRAKARLGGHELVGDPIRDMDESGGNLKRPGWERAYEMVMGDEADGVAIAKLDRFSRNLREALDVIEELEKHDKVLISAQDDFDPTTPMGRFARDLVIRLAQMERERLADSWNASRKSAVARGIHVASRAPTGYQRGEDRKLVRDPKAAAVVREVFRRRAKGVGWTALADYMTKRGVVGPYGSTVWTPSVVRNLVTNRAYLGEARSGEHVKPDAHDAIVTPAAFAAAQPGRIGLTPRKGDGLLLSGIVRCASCRFVTKADHMRDRDGERLGLYRCRVRHSKQRCPAPVSVLSRVLEPYVEEHFLTALGAGPLAEAALSTAETEEAAQAVEEAETELVAYRDANLVSVLGREAYVAGLETRARTVDETRAKLAKTRERSALIEMLPQTPSALVEAWPTLTVAEKREILSDAIDAVFVWPMRGLGRQTTIEERVAILWRSEAPDDLPRRGRRGPLRSYERPDDVGVTSTKHTEPGAPDGRSSRGRKS